MTPTKKLINAVHDHFAERVRLANAMLSIQCYPKGASYYYSFKDGWDNKKNVNLPFRPDDVLPILQRYIDNIDKDIVYMAIDLQIDSEDDLKDIIEDRKELYPKLYVPMDKVKESLKKMYAERLMNCKGETDDDEDEAVRKHPYNIYTVYGCTDEYYQFWCVGQCKYTVLFGFNGVASNEADT